MPCQLNLVGELLRSRAGKTDQNNDLWGRRSIAAPPVCVGAADHLRQMIGSPVKVNSTGLSVVPGKNGSARLFGFRQFFVDRRDRFCEFGPTNLLRKVVMYFIR